MQKKMTTTNSFLSKVLEVIHGLNERGIEFKITGFDLVEPNHSHGHFVKKNWAKARAYAKAHGISVKEARSILSQLGKDKVVSNSIVANDWKQARQLSKKHHLNMMEARRIVTFIRKERPSKQEIDRLIQNARLVAN